MRISEKLQNHRSKSTKPTFSFEYFVPKTTQGVQNLYDRMDRMYQSTLPQFIDVTWNAGGGVLSQLTTDLVETSQSVLGLETCMHLTCTNMPVSQIDDALESARLSGCQNILALRGDPPVNSDSWQPVEGGFQYAKDLVRYIRDKYGDYFDIGVAGYPEGHPETAGDDETLLDHLKEKVDAGANFIITQMFYDADLFIKWCQRVRAKGVDVPLIPGIMPITTYAAFLRRANWCDVHIPQEYFDRLDPIKDDDQLVREVGTDLIVSLCQKLLDSGYVSHLHIYTMNLEKAPQMILDRMELLPSHDEPLDNHLAILPWRKSLNPQRRNEEVRPIFWQRRPYSYVARTSQWSVDEFPNGRFGDSSSPAFGDLDLCGASLIRQSGKKSLELWSAPNSMEDIAQLVINYLRGELKYLPWSDTSLNHEVDDILPELVTLNQKLIITINSQPQLNGVKSSHPVHGWGPRDGYVYQKMYLEFLLPKEKLSKLHDCLVNDVMLTYFAVDHNGNLTTNHQDGTRANAVTWGIFPGREVLQPTIVEKVSFLAWKQEFYHICEEWKLNFINHRCDQSVKLLQHLIDDYVLVNIVDNDFISPENRIFNLLSSI
ncbi:hypothetical protein ZYGR_0P00750 [Zygosaccharomyces rouxii]|uniref:ZYRO0E01870p n=2 Tax=Zygosaccharomyces rouxii TaxID=4956 RepID=C5E412_ZYGRC|nr:uncharacterized protein ZYRO0E01870g [Zygosaccharomyces rouxii]KAH9198366.1 methylenetetrahydrofolate reductase-domain-containing protein [Zygosaccharomyces rouxii]GAV49432.1 hypothetical protein ZYGR_0P00750 [Zygosaccharomyces rouxii]CAR30773.1 ZYRO0E01870p [Zygosaccharomyces rouxii]